MTMFPYDRYYHYYTLIDNLFNPHGEDGFNFIERINMLFNGDERGIKCVLMIYYLHIDIRKAYEQAYARQVQFARKERFLNTLYNSVSDSIQYIV